MHLNLLAKIELRGPGSLIVKLLLCFTVVLLYAKMLRETETEETIVFFVTFLSLVAFQLGLLRAPWTSLITPKGGGELLLKNGTIDGYTF